MSAELRIGEADPRDITIVIAGDSYPGDWDPERLRVRLEAGMRQVISDYKAAVDGALAELQRANNVRDRALSILSDVRP